MALKRASKRMNRLIIISCSQAKVLKPRAAIPALERYDGVLYKVLRKAKRESRFPDNTHIAIISARHGLIDAQTPIASYEKSLDSATARSLQPKVQQDVSALLKKGRYRDICVNLGRKYAALLPDLSPIRNATWAEGGLGQRAAHLKAWLTEMANAS